MNYLAGTFTILVGGFLLLGVKQKWRWLVDPPEDWSPFYSQAFLKENFGPNAPRTLARCLGIGLIALGIAFIVFGSKRSP
jgi:hypothetical protein